MVSNLGADVGSTLISYQPLAVTHQIFNFYTLIHFGGLRQGSNVGYEVELWHHHQPSAYISL